MLVFFQNAAAAALLKCYYPPVAAVSFSYKKDAIRKECLIDGELKGFGQLHPCSQEVETLGTCPFLLSFLIYMPLASININVWTSNYLSVHRSSIYIYFADCANETMELIKANSQLTVVNLQKINLPIV